MGKSHTGIDAVALSDFGNGGTAEVVHHGHLRLITACDPPADEPWKIIERSEFLLKLQPRLPYHLIGHNCEHIANMCVAGGWTESYQVRRVFGLRALAAFGFLVWLGGQRRANLPVPRWVNWVAGAPLLRTGGQGQGRTADLPLFRRTLIPTELPDRAGGSRSARS